MEESSVKVAVRIRPQIQRELLEMCHVCTSVTPNEPQVWLGSDKAFTFDHVFDIPTQQTSVYETCIRNLINGCLDGYNATVLAYGQTGSGKTYTMGTGFDVNIDANDIGIIPRAVEQLFMGIAERQNDAKDRDQRPPEFKVVAQFMELYNEEIIDLLDPMQDCDDKTKKMHVKIHEDPQGGIYTLGLVSRSVSSADEAIQCLKIGALSRTTASTQMNVQSSRSHAVFTLHIKQERVVEYQPIDVDGTQNAMEEEFETLTAKFHFVDLAGSERLKRTGATGDRAKEGISINCGLLALGNVISALGDKTRRATHIPYRDSKLTRLLQDSLGGNSQTLMIACISPSDRDFMETLNTLKYANRAKNIKNKVCINQDKSNQLISVLRRENEQLKLELMEYKQGKRLVGEDGIEQVNDMFHENNMLLTENNTLRTRLKALQETVEHQTCRVTDLLAEKSFGNWVALGEDGSQSEITDVIKQYLKENEDLRAKLLESEQIASQLRKQLQRAQVRLSFNSPGMKGDSFPNTSFGGNSTANLIAEAKQEIKKLKQTKELQSCINMEKGSKEELKKENEEEKAGVEIEVNGISGEDASHAEDEEDEDDEQDDQSSDSEDEAKSVQEEYSNDLAELTMDISMKQKLIEELEHSQHRLVTMKRHYEEKVIRLEQKIRETEIERDRVLANLNYSKESQSDNAKKVKVDFEKKLTTLQKELKKLQVAKKEHAQLMRNQNQSERQINQLKNELAEMKTTKVKLMKKMKEESQRHKTTEQRINREIVQLKKHGRVQENKIRNLEADKRLKDNVLRRKQEELMSLRRNAKPMSDTVAGRLPQNNKLFVIKRSLPFSPKVAKARWQKLEKSINQLVISKQTVFNIERDMERFLKKREKLTKNLESLEKKRKIAVLKRKGDNVIQDYEDQIENLKANINYCHENISECQTSIVQVEETKDDMDILDVKNLVFKLSNDESRYLLEKLLSVVIHQTFQVVQKDTEIREMTAKLEHTKSSTDFQVQLLEQLVQDANPEILDFINNDEPVSESQASSRSSSPVDSSVSEVSTGITFGWESPQLKGRKTAVPAELMSHRSSQVPTLSTRAGISEVDDKPLTSRLAWSFGPALQQELDAASAGPTIMEPDRSIVRVTSAPTSLKETTVSDISPPNSPTAARKLRDDNVFSRLTSGSFRSSKPMRGFIEPFMSKMNMGRNSPLICTHIAKGHNRAALSVAATDDVLFSGSKDRTVKIWDLTTGREIQSLDGHPNNVCAIRYNEYSRLAFSVSTAYIKVWDVRENPGRCIKTLSSSGTCNPTSVAANTPSRSLILPPGESHIHDIALNRYGTTLFSAASSIVRMWDLRMFQAIGKLSGGHQAPIMCLAVDNKGTEKNVVVTGSKDHYIKVFEVMESAGGCHSPKMNLEPPHYDGIQSLAMNKDILFSGSRDKSIKKFNLKTRSHVQSLNQAHRDWICALCFLPDGTTITSGCRGGFLKLWATDSTQLLGEIRAHSAPINAIAANSSLVFTASSDCSIGIWRLRTSSDVSPEGDGLE